MSRRITNPKRSDRLIFCDVCGSRYTIKEVLKVSDRYNRRFGLILCKPCYRASRTNAQDRPFMVNEILLTAPDLVRADPEPIYSINDNDNRLPGKPGDGWIVVDPLMNNLIMVWQPPQDQGSSLIVGYKIRRATPQLSTYVVLSTSTETGACYYNDTTAVLTTDYSYTVAAINGFGEGPESNIIYWLRNPALPEDIQYLIDENGYVITDENGYTMRVNYPNSGVL